MNSPSMLKMSSYREDKLIYPSRRMNWNILQEDKWTNLVCKLWQTCYQYFENILKWCLQIRQNLDVFDLVVIKINKVGLRYYIWLIKTVIPGLYFSWLLHLLVNIRYTGNGGFANIQKDKFKRRKNDKKSFRMSFRFKIYNS